MAGRQSSQSDFFLEVLYRASRVLGKTQTQLTREMLVNPIGILSSFAEKVEALEARLRDLEDASVKLKSLNLNGEAACFLIVVPRKWEKMFERFIALKGLEAAFRRFIYEFAQGNMDPNSIDVNLEARRI